MAETTCQTPECPRCGYDLTGLAAAGAVTPATHDAAPGRCSECGLDFIWGDIFHPDRTRVRGFIEQSPAGFVSHIGASLTTLRLALRPWTFWSRVRLEMTPRVDRMGLWLASWAVLWVFAVAVCMGLFWIAGRIAARPLPRTVTANSFTLGFYFGPGRSKHLFDPLSNAGIVSLACLTASLAAPLMILLLPHTRARAKLRGEHVLRAATFGTSWFAILLLLRAPWSIAHFALFIVIVRMFARSKQGGPTGEGWPLTASRLLYRASEVLSEGWWLAMITWISLWWLFAIKWGWRIEQPGRVWLATIVPAWLAFFIVLMNSHLGQGLFH